MNLSNFNFISQNALKAVCRQRILPGSSNRIIPTFVNDFLVVPMRKSSVGSEWRVSHRPTHSGTWRKKVRWFNTEYSGQ